MNTGTVAVLNVGAGDTKLSFDKNNPAERIRAARVIADMLKRGYALLIEHPAGSGTYTRALDFDEDVCQYIIADFDPVTAEAADAAEAVGETDGKEQGQAEAGTPQATPPRTSARSKVIRKRVDAEGTKAVSVARIAGG